MSLWLCAPISPSRRLTLPLSGARQGAHAKHGSEPQTGDYAHAATIFAIASPSWRWPFASGCTPLTGISHLALGHRWCLTFGAEAVAPARPGRCKSPQAKGEASEPKVRESKVVVGASPKRPVVFPVGSGDG